MSRSSSGSSRANVYLVMNMLSAGILHKKTRSMLGTNASSCVFACPNHRNLFFIEESGNEAK